MATRVDELLAKQAALKIELDAAMKEDRAAVLKDLKEKIKLFNFKTTDFKGVLATRKKRGETEADTAKKAPAKKKTSKVI